jgi:Ca-activated chloride channel family protein
VFRSTIRRIALLLFVVPLSKPLVAQDASRRPITCETRVCVAAPCPPPPCGQREQVVRTGRDVRVVLDGRILRYEVTERWTNHGSRIGEADYVLPLPRGAAFEDLALEIDGEMVTGEALGAGEARRIYEEIVRRQRDPALVEWMDLGVLRTRIFPIQPGETRTVVVRFRAVAEREGDALRVDVPAPRGNGTMSSGTTLTFSWPQADEFGDTWSPTHRAVQTRDGSRRALHVSEATGTVTLLVPVRAGRSAALSVLAHAPDRNEGYALITLTPPIRAAAAMARDVTFVLDVSGSMSGGKIEQARAAGRQLLNSLGASDRFRLIAFSGDVQEFRDGWAPVTPTDRRAAERWLNELGASGGTNIAGALERALETRAMAGRLGLVLFLTDGAPTVGERRGDVLAARAAELRGTRRIFTFGLGADVNAALLERLALDGAGTAHFVRPEEDVERVVGVVAQRITRPVATNLRIRAEGVRLHAVQPAGRLDLFAGQELTVLARYTGASESGRVLITGETPEGPVTWSVDARFPARRTADAFVGRLWATQRVGWLSAERRRNGANAEVDGEMRALGEKWGIPTELTSYLVLEPGMVANNAQVGGGPMPTTDAPTRRGERDRVGRDMRSSGSSSGAGVASPAAPPPSAFEAAKAAAEMRSARSVGELLADRDDSALRRTANRVFALRDSVWVDTRAEAAGARRVTVKPFSPAYFALIDGVSELREILAIGERVRVHGTRVTLVLADDGAERLGAGVIADFVRDW